MTDRLTETELTETLDGDGQWPGVYALRLKTPPDDVPRVFDCWGAEFDAELAAADAMLLAECEELLYVGSHAQNVYRRMAQHCRGHKASTIMSVWEPVAVAGYWPADAVQSEWTKANALAGGGTLVWRDGQIHT